MSRSALEKQWRQQHAAASVAQSFQSAPTHQYPSDYNPYAALPTASESNAMFAPYSSNDVAEEVYEDDEPKRNILPLHGNTNNFNINTLLFENIMSNDYFRALYQLRTYHEVIDEIKRSVKHVEPWQTGTSRFPSSSFCLLVKFMLMRLTMKQMNGLLDSDLSPYLRAIGFLYLRYTAPPNDLYNWFEPYLKDSEEITPTSDKSIKMTMGMYCVKLLTDMQYYGTTLPRIPVPIERKIKVLLLLLEDKKKQREKNIQLLVKYKEEIFLVGSKILAIYSDEETEPAWYEATIDSQDEEQENKYWVTFIDYGNKECVDLGDMRVLDDKKYSIDSHNRDSHRRSRTKSSGGSKQCGSANDLLEKVMQEGRHASAAVGRNYGQRPASYKGSLFTITFFKLL